MMIMIMEDFSALTVGLMTKRTSGLLKPLGTVVNISVLSTVQCEVPYEFWPLCDDAQDKDNWRLTIKRATG